MNLKELIVPLGLVLFTTWAVQYFILNRYASNPEETIKAGQSFKAPQNVNELKPLNTQFALAINDLHEPVLTTIETPKAQLVFSNHGAVLTSFTVKRERHTGADRMITITPADMPENACFLIALEQESPYEYSLVDVQEYDNKVLVSYKAECQAGSIEKVFTILNDSYAIECAITLIPSEKNKASMQARVVIPSPITPEGLRNEIPYAVVANEKGSIIKESINDLDIHKGWFAPSLFGSDNKYFINALVADADVFVQRAYYKKIHKNQLVAILEGPEVTIPTTWHLRFYIGSKEEKAMLQVDSRLEQTLDYSGILAPISKLLLSLLVLIYGYVHNYGFALVLLTILINLILWPLNMRNNQGRKKHEEFQKKMAHLKYKYKDEPERLAQEQTELIKKHGFGMGACLPRLLQFPIFIALSRVVSSSVEFYKAPFIGWIHDLSAVDPYYVLPFFIFACLFIQALTVDRSQQISIIIVALLFGAMSVNFSAGLSLYIVIGAIMSLLQVFIFEKGRNSIKHA